MVKRLFYATVFSVLSVVLIESKSVAETVKYTSSEDGSSFYFKIPSKECSFKKNEKSEAIGLGEGSMGIVFKVDCGGSIKTLKYFKTNEYYDKKSINIYRYLAYEYVRDPVSNTGELVEHIDGDLVEFDIFNAPGAAEDIVFDAQHQMERLTHESILSSKPVSMEFGTGSVDVREIDLEVFHDIEGGGKPPEENLQKVTALIKPLIRGENLKNIIENSRLNEAMINAIVRELEIMSVHGMFYDDLNEANWFILGQGKVTGQDHKGNKVYSQYIAVPFDMKPGRFVGSYGRAFKKNCKGIVKKIAPLGLSSGGFFRSGLISVKNSLGAGKFHAKISKGNESIEKLVKRLKQEMAQFQNNKYRPKAWYRRQ